VRPGGVGPREPLEQLRQQVRRDARPVIGDGQHHARLRRHHAAPHGGDRGRGGPPGPCPGPRLVGTALAGTALVAGGLLVAADLLVDIVLLIDTEPDRDRRPLRRVPARVAEQVDEHLLQPVLVAGDRDRVVGQVQDPAVPGPGDPRVARGVDGDAGDVDRLAVQRPAGVKPGEQQQVVHENGHPGGLRQDPAQRVRHRFGGVPGAAQRELSVAPDDGERRAQLVARVGCEPAQPRLARVPARQCGLHVPEHPVEGGAQLAGLGARVGVRHPGGKLDLT
jgi:hypothetical protein